jgi:glycosyl transferase family 25
MIMEQPRPVAITRPGWGVHPEGCFTHKVCINLDRRPERWEQMREKFCRHGISEVNRFSAIDGDCLSVPAQWAGSAGALGCLHSNVAVVEYARDKRWPDVLIFEDDVAFDEGYAPKLEGYLRQLPDDWDMVLFGAMHRQEPVRISENVYKVTGSTSTYAYALRETIYSAFIDLNRSSTEPVDVNNQRLQQMFNCYCFIPHLAWAEGGHSDTHGRAVNPWWLGESLILGGSAMDAILKRTLVTIPHRDRTIRQLGTRNLYHNVKAYHALLPGAAVLIVEQDTSSTVDCAWLPTGCEYIRIPDGGRLNQPVCFNEGVRRFGEGRDFLAFADRDLLPGWDIRAGLKKCLEFDFISSFERVIELSAEDTYRVTRGERFVASRDIMRRRENICSDMCIFSRRGFEVVGGWDEYAGDDRYEIQAGKIKRLLNVFESPGWAFKLFSASRGETKASAGR